MDKACDQVEDVIDEFHQYLLDSESTLSCIDPETMLKTECLIKHLGGLDQIDPSCEECDSSVGTFMMFVLRDFLEYAGLLTKKKSIPGK